MIRQSAVSYQQLWPTLALVADKDQTRRIYRIRTVLTMHLAYVDAGPITRPDREWLNPFGPVTK